MSQQSTGFLNPIFRKTLRAIKGKDYNQGFSLPGAFYTDPAWMEAECDELFISDWFCVGGLKRYRNRETFSASITSVSRF